MDGEVEGGGFGEAEGEEEEVLEEDGLGGEEVGVGVGGRVVRVLVVERVVGCVVGYVGGEACEVGGEGWEGRRWELGC